MSEREELDNLIHREAMRVLHRSTRRTPCVVDSYDPKTHAVKVRLMPDSLDASNPVVTGWMPLHPLQTGSLFGWHMPPNIGDHGWVEFHDSDREAGQFVVATFNDKFQPVDTVQAGEWLYKNKWGALINFKSDGSITVTDKAGSTVVLDGTGNVTAQNTAGSELMLEASGHVGIKPKDDGLHYVFLGGLPGDNHTYFFVSTTGGPSMNVKARTA